MPENKNYLSLKKISIELGASLFGVADISEVRSEFRLPQEIIQRFDRAICLGVRLSKSVLDEIDSYPTLLYFRNYRSANVLLDQIALRISNILDNQGFFSMPIPASQVIDWKHQIAHLSHKKIGYLAGLGWMGRNNLLVNKELGSQFRLVSILTNMPIKADRPVQYSCGECRQCIITCPAQAIKEKQSDFDHLKCFDKLKEFHKKRLAEQYICGVCVKACPGKT